MGAEKTVVGVGSCCVAPSGVTHGLKNNGSEPVELLALFTPPLK
jgi:mannose-6-phosphate isomerase-like protein (cupin superfamily)